MAGHAAGGTARATATLVAGCAMCVPAVALLLSPDLAYFPPVPPPWRPFAVAALVLAGPLVAAAGWARARFLRRAPSSLPHPTRRRARRAALASWAVCGIAVAFLLLLLNARTPGLRLLLGTGGVALVAVPWLRAWQAWWLSGLPVHAGPDACPPGAWGGAWSGVGLMLLGGTAMATSADGGSLFNLPFVGGVFLLAAGGLLALVGCVVATGDLLRACLRPPAALPRVAPPGTPAAAPRPPPGALRQRRP